MIEAQRKACVAMELLSQPTPHQGSVDSCPEGAQEGTECVMTMEVNEMDYRQPDALILNHPVVTNFLSRKDNELQGSIKQCQAGQVLLLRALQWSQSSEGLSSPGTPLCYHDLGRQG
jgi:hypothetical protein